MDIKLWENITKLTAYKKHCLKGLLDNDYNQSKTYTMLLIVY